MVTQIKNHNFKETIDNICTGIFELSGYKLTTSPDETTELNHLQEINNLIEKKTDNPSLVSYMMVDSVIKYKKKLGLIHPLTLTKVEFDRISKDFSYFVSSMYKEDNFADYKADVSRAFGNILNPILQLKDVSYLSSKTLALDKVNPNFVKAYRKILPNLIVSQLGNPEKQKSYSKEAIKQRKILKLLIKKQVVGLESNGFKVEQKRDLLSLHENDHVAQIISTFKKSDDLTNQKIKELNELIVDYTVARPVRFTAKEQDAITASIIEHYNSNYDKYNVNLPYNDIPNEILKVSKRVVDFKALKDKNHYSDVSVFKNNVSDSISGVIEMMFNEQVKVAESKKINYEAVFNEVYRLVEDVCTFNQQDEIAFKMIKSVVDKLEQQTVIDNIKYVPETMTAIISYNNNQGMFLVNPYVLIEVYNKRVYADRTGQLDLGKGVKANRITSGLANFLFNNLKQIYRKRGNLNIITKPFTVEADYNRVIALQKGFENQIDLLMEHKIRFKEGLDSTGRANRMNVQINNRSFIISPSFILDIDTKQFLFKRENPSTTLKELSESAFANKTLMGVPAESHKILNIFLRTVFDLRKNI